MTSGAESVCVPRAMSTRVPGIASRTACSSVGTSVGTRRVYWIGTSACGTLGTIAGSHEASARRGEGGRISASARPALGCASAWRGGGWSESCCSGCRGDERFGSCGLLFPRAASFSCHGLPKPRLDLKPGDGFIGDCICRSAIMSPSTWFTRKGPWSCSRQSGQRGAQTIACRRQSAQKLCPHGVETGSLSSSVRVQGRSG